MTDQPAPAPAPGSRGWWAGTLPVPTPRAAAAVALSAVLVLVVPDAWGAAVLVALVVVVDGLRSVRPWRIAVSREVPAVVVLDTEAPIGWTVTTPGPAARVVLADDVAPSLGVAHRRVTVDVPADGQVRAQTSMRPRRRGRFEPGRLAVRTLGPWGLASRQHTRDLAATIDVHPVFRSRKEAELRITRGRILEVGLRSAKALGRGTEFEALREYNQDDDIRRIDWSATARRGRPIVRTYREERNQTVLVMLDTGRLMAGLVEDVPRLDHAMDAAMALTTVATRLGDRAGLVAFSSGIRATVPPRADSGQLRRVTRALFDLEPDLTESAYDEVFSATMAMQRRRGLLVLLTELSSEALAESMVPSLPLLLRHHLVIVGSVRDPAVEGWRTDAPDAATGAYRAAGAATVARVRSRTGDLLSQMGARVVDAPPAAFGAALADAYLEVKTSGRL